MYIWTWTSSSDSPPETEWAYFPKCQNYSFKLLSFSKRLRKTHTHYLSSSTLCPSCQWSHSRVVQLSPFQPSVQLLNTYLRYFWEDNITSVHLQAPWGSLNITLLNWSRLRQKTNRCAIGNSGILVFAVLLLYYYVLIQYNWPRPMCFLCSEKQLCMCCVGTTR